MTKLETRSQRKDAFRKIGDYLRDYQTGRESQFEIKGRAVKHRDVSSRLYGPQLRTQQWERTIRE